jgi:NADH-quinone oxidoreductase subunit D
VTFEHLTPAADSDTYYLNMGPQHPSMHGVLRLLLHLQGEKILEADPHIGYAHRAHEKMAENRTWIQFLPNTSRVDYLSGMICNLSYVQALEKMLDVEVPERAEHIRIVVGEFNRISSHLLWLGTFLLDLGGVTPFLYCFEDRERILDLLDSVTGSRLTYSYGRVGGVSRDVDEDFLAGCRALVQHLRTRFPDYRALVEKNAIFERRCREVGVIDRETARRYGVTGPCLRASGVAHDLRKAEPYGIYDRLDFEVPVREEGDALARYRVRVDEMEQCCRLVEQAVAAMPGGEVKPKRLIRRIKPPAGETYFAVETARGHYGTYLVSDGGEVPLRIKIRPPSFSNLSAMPEVMAGTMVADTIAILGSIDIVLPEVDR